MLVMNSKLTTYTAYIFLPEFLRTVDKGMPCFDRLLDMYPQAKMNTWGFIL